MGINLPPTEIIPNILHTRVTSGPTIEAGRSQQGLLLLLLLLPSSFPPSPSLAGEIAGPEENVPPREGGHHGAHELLLAPIKEGALARQQEGEFVRHAVGYGYVGEGAQGGAGAGVHEVEGARVVGLLEVVARGEVGEGAAVQAEDYVGVEQEGVGGFEVADVFVSGLGGLVGWLGNVGSGGGGGTLSLPFWLVGGCGGGGDCWDDSFWWWWEWWGMVG